MISLLAGCGGGGGGGGGGNNGGGGGGTVSVSTTAPSGLVATLSEPSATVGVGGAVTYTLSIANPTANAIAIQSDSPAAPTTPAATLVVRDAAGNQTYAPLPGKPAIYNAVLSPGQTLTTTINVSTSPTTGGLVFGTRGVYSATANFGETIPATTVGPLTVTAQ